jgi:ATP-binding cassette subfamily B protein
MTAMVLEEGTAFGAEQGLNQPFIPYRAIAASEEVEVARIPASTLAEWHRQQFEWCQPLADLSNQRQRTIFFKTATDLHSVPFLFLQPLAEKLEEYRLAPGTSLRDWARQHPGYLWLRSGDVQSSQTPAPAIGTGWKDADAVPEPWVAATELLLYRLSPDHEEVLHPLAPYWPLPAGTDNGHGSGARANPINSPNRPITYRSPRAINAISATSSAEAASNGAYPRHASTGNASARSVNAPVSANDHLPEDRDQDIFPKPLRRQALDLLQRFPWVEQQSSSDCGVACLSMICRYWGKRFPIHALRERANVGRSGASLKSLAKAAEGLGFHARPVRASLGRMMEQANPWIAHWEGNHYVVVYQSRGDRIVIADPALGRRTVSRQAFQAGWTGYALLLDPTSQLQEIDIQQTSLMRYFGALAPYQGVIMQVILVSILIQLFSLVTPLFTQIILDKVIVQKSVTTLNVFAIGLLLFGVWGIFMSSIRQYLLSYFSNRLDLTLISGFIKHALSLPLKYFESRRVGDIITRVQENQKIQRFLIGQVVLAWLNFLTGFVYLGLMLYYNWQLTVLVLLIIPPIILLTLGATPFLRRVSRQVFKEVADQNSILVEMMTGVSTLKSVAAERELRWRWEDQLTRQMNMVFRGQKLGIGLGAASGLINTLGSTALLWYGATLVIQDQLTIGQFVAFNMMIGYVISPVLALTNLWDELQEVFISVERLNDVFEAQPEETPQQQLLIMPPIWGDVEFENVTFRYNEEDDRNVLQNIDFRVTAGQTIAVVGRSGSGKSTLVKLLEGLYHPLQGRVVIDGHDIRHVSPPSLRSQIGVVPQDCFLFSGTILENITLYRSEFTMEQAIEAARLAEAHAFIQALPLGYGTKVGERGSSLSGGQRQRIAIARALLGNPRILILDEATSSLDTESERRFQRNLEQLQRDRTTFIIAHRLSTVRNADRILVLDRGILAEQGTHDELMAKAGIYHTLANQQLDL